MDNGFAQVEDGQRRGSHLIHNHDGYFYHVREVRGNRVRLWCRSRNRGCRGTALTRLDDMRVIHLAAHNHPPDLLFVEDMNMRRALIAEASILLSGKTSTQILIEAKSNCLNVELSSRFTTARMRRALDFARMKNYPAIPRTLMQLGISLGLPGTRAITATRDGIDLIFRGVVGSVEDQTLSVVFISGRMLQFLEERVSIHSDGTFKKRPKKPKVSQIFNIGTRYGFAVIGIMRVLMQRRTYEAYLALFRFIRNLLPNFRPARIHCDFEKAQMKAWLHVFPFSYVLGCLWHYAVAVSSYARDLGLGPLAAASEAVMSIIRCLCAVPLLPRDEIAEGMRELWEAVKASPWKREFIPLFQYWDKEWLPRLPALSVFGSPERTNNVAESDNRMLANVFPANSPNIWRVINGFVTLEHLAWGDKLAIDRGQVVTGPRRASTIATDRIVKRFSDMLLVGDVTPLQLIRSVSWRLSPAVYHGLRVISNVDSSSDESDDLSDDSE